MTQLVIPAPDAFGGRVTPSTPLGVLVAVLRRSNPRAPFGQLKRAAEELRAGKVSREPRPDRFDSGTDSGAVPSAVVDADARAPESEVAEPDASAPASIAIERELERKPTRAEVEAWLAEQPKRNRPTMSKSGRIPAAILTAYREAHREEMLASMVPVEGGAPMPADVPPADVH